MDSVVGRDVARDAASVVVLGLRQGRNVGVLTDSALDNFLRDFELFWDLVVIRVLKLRF